MNAGLEKRRSVFAVVAGWATRWFAPAPDAGITPRHADSQDIRSGSLPAKSDNWAVANAAAGITLLLVTHAALAGGTKINDVVAASDQWMMAQVDSQKRVDKLADEKQSMADDYRNTLRESDSLKLYIEQLKAQLKSQQEEMDSVRGEQRNIAQTNVEILPLMQDMLAALGKFVELDVPFLLDERRERVKKLNDMMPRADVTVSEKFRRIVEAYQLEIDYGRTIESYVGNLNGKDVAFLRVGRVGLLYQTPDGKETGYWDGGKKGWVPDNSYTDGVREGLKVARKQTSPDLLIVPIQAAAK